MTTTPPTRTPSIEAEDPFWDLEALYDARRLGDWMYEQFAPYVRGLVVEVGAGIGTFSERILSDSVDSLLLIEPEAPCAAELRRRIGDDPRVEVVSELLPASPALGARAQACDFVLCQNVLEHIDDDYAAVDAMADALRPGGVLTLLVPAHPRLYNELDRRYDHRRRYSRERIRGAVRGADLELERLYSFNALGVAGWWVNRSRTDARVSPRALRAYEELVRFWKPIESRFGTPFGLSLIAHARRSASPRRP